MNKIARTLVFGLTLTAFGQAPNQVPTPVPMTAKEARSLEVRARTPEDHRKLAAYYRADSLINRAEAQKHSAEADAFARKPTGDDLKHPMSYRTEAHCRWLARNCIPS